MSVLAGADVLQTALESPPAATLSNALATGGVHVSLMTDESILIFGLNRATERLQIVARLSCAEGPEAHAWAPDGSIFALASARRLLPHDSFRLIHSIPLHHIPTSLAIASCQGATSWQLAIGGANGVDVYHITLADCGVQIAALAFTRVSPPYSILIATYDGHIGHLQPPTLPSGADSTISWLDWIDTPRITCLVLSPSLRLVAISGWEGAHHFYDFDGTKLTPIQPQYPSTCSSSSSNNATRSHSEMKPAFVVWSPNASRVALSRQGGAVAASVLQPSEGLPEWTLPGVSPAGFASLQRCNVALDLSHCVSCSEQLVICCDRVNGLRAFYWPLSCVAADSTNLPLHDHLLPISPPSALLPPPPSFPRCQAYLKTSSSSSSLTWSHRSLSLSVTWAASSLTLPAPFLHREIDLRRFGSQRVACGGVAFSVFIDSTVFLVSSTHRRWLALAHSHPVQCMCFANDLLVVLEGEPQTPQFTIWDTNGLRLLCTPLVPPLPSQRCRLLGDSSETKFTVVHLNERLEGRITRTTQGKAVLLLQQMP